MGATSDWQNYFERETDAGRTVDAWRWRVKKKKKEANPIREMVAYTVIVFTLLLGACWYFAPTMKGVPEDLIGRYHTNDERYGDRGLEIDSVSINFATGDGRVSVGIIDDVKLRMEGGKMLYTIKYTSDEAKSEVSFYYEPGKEQVIRFKNQDKIAWTKDEKTNL
jgi:hypothetical protein